MFYNIELVKNGFTIRKSTDQPYNDDIYVFLNLDDALNWIKNDIVVKA
jgi:hypothetical protein